MKLLGYRSLPDCLVDLTAKAFYLSFLIFMAGIGRAIVGQVGLITKLGSREKRFVIIEMKTTNYSVDYDMERGTIWYRETLLQDNISQSRDWKTINQDRAVESACDELEKRYEINRKARCLTAGIQDRHELERAPTRVMDHQRDRPFIKNACGRDDDLENEYWDMTTRETGREDTDKGNDGYRSGRH